MNTLHEICAVLADGRTAWEAINHIWTVTWSAMVGGAAVFLILTTFTATEPFL